MATLSLKKSCCNESSRSWTVERNFTMHMVSYFQCSMWLKNVTSNCPYVANGRHSQLLSQTVNSGKLVIIPKIVASFDDLKFDRGSKKIDGKIAHCTTFQRSISEPCGLKRLFSSKNCTRMSVSRQVGGKA